jgi:hypothetical protein
MILINDCRGMIKTGMVLNETIFHQPSSYLKLRTNCQV